MDWPGTDEVCWIDVAKGRVSRRTGLLCDFRFDPHPLDDPAVSPDLHTAALLGIEDWPELTLRDTRRGPAGDRPVSVGYMRVGGLCFDPAGRWLYMVGYRGDPAPAFRQPPSCEVVRCEPGPVLRGRQPRFVPQQLVNPLTGGVYIQQRPVPPDPWQAVASIPNRKAGITIQAIAPDGHSLAAGSAQGSVWVFGLPSADRVSKLSNLTDPGRDPTVYRLAFSPDSQRLAALGRKGVVCRSLSRPGKIWRSGRPIVAPRNMAFCPDGETILISDLCGSVFELEVSSGGLRRTHSPNAGPLYGVAVSPRGRRAAAGTADGRVVIWELEQSA